VHFTGSGTGRRTRAATLRLKRDWSRDGTSRFGSPSIIGNDTSLALSSVWGFAKPPANAPHTMVPVFGLIRFERRIPGMRVTGFGFGS